jgi:phage/plasmid-like protein (TIGR03299 family)
MNTQENVQDILNKSNLNWKVRSETITTESGIILSEKALIRDDTNVPLSIRAESYHPFQNDEMIELLLKVSSMTGYEVKKGGYFGNGEKVYVQLKSDDLKLGNDRIEGYLTGLNSFDGSTSLAFGPSNVTISCQNTFFASYREIKTRVRHTKNMMVQIDEICRRLDTARNEEKLIFEKIIRFSETPFDDVLKQKVSKMLFNVDRKLDLNNMKDRELISTRTLNNLSRFYIDLDGELKEKGETMWGLFSGITKYTTHSLKGDPMENKLFGTYGKRELGIFNHMTELV